MDKVTLWSIVKEGEGSTSFNHIEDEWVSGYYPKPIKEEFTNQKAWENMEWVKEYVCLENGKIVRF